MRNKRKGILMATAILGSAAIVSTGFAAWVITAPSATFAEGNIEVDTVTDNRVKMTAEWASKDDGTVVFGAPETQAKDAWLINNEKEEHLEHTLNITFTPSGNGKTEDIDGTLIANIEVGTRNSDGEFVADCNISINVKSKGIKEFKL